MSIDLIGRFPPFCDLKSCPIGTIAHPASRDALQTHPRQLDGGRSRFRSALSLAPLVFYESRRRVLTRNRHRARVNEQRPARMIGNAATCRKMMCDDLRRIFGSGSHRPRLLTPANLIRPYCSPSEVEWCDL